MTVTGKIQSVVHGSDIDTVTFTAVQVNPEHGNKTINVTFYETPGTFVQGQTATLDIV